MISSLFSKKTIGSSFMALSSIDNDTKSFAISLVLASLKIMMNIYAQAAQHIRSFPIEFECPESKSKNGQSQSRSQSQTKKSS
ncbi:hypothetical protein ACLB2K_012884 [Fragaria x ananassa]